MPHHTGRLPTQHVLLDIHRRLSERTHKAPFLSYSGRHDIIRLRTVTLAALPPDARNMDDDGRRAVRTQDTSHSVPALQPQKALTSSVCAPQCVDGRGGELGENGGLGGVGENGELRGARHTSLATRRLMKAKSAFASNGS